MTTIDDDRVKHLEALLMDYVERFGLTQAARTYFSARRDATQTSAETASGNDNAPCDDARRNAPRRSA